MKFDGYQSMFKTETKRLIWVLAVLFSMVIMVQYFELPYRTIRGYFLSFEKFGSWNSISMNETNHMSNDVSSEGKIIDFNNGNVSLSSEGKIRGFDNGNVSVSSEGKITDLNYGNFSLSSEGQIRGFDSGNISSSSGSKVTNLSNGNASLSSEEKIGDFNNGLVLGDEGGRSDSFDGSNSTVQISLAPERATRFEDDDHVKAEMNVSLTPIVSPSPSLTTSDMIPNSLWCENPLVKEKALVDKEMAAVSISEMKDMLIQNQSSYLLVKPLWPSVVDQELLNAKSQIQNAPIIRDDDNLHAPVYWNVSKFKRSYELMEQTLKVYIYGEGEMPVFHQPELTGIYASEGWFMKQLITNTKFVTKDPLEAHLFYLPFSSHNLEKNLYVRDSHSFKNLIEYLKNYVDLIKGRYPFWNRTCGADHFLVACHDWGAEETRYHMYNCIRSLCNSDLREGFQLGKDVSLPETYIQSAKNPSRNIGGRSPRKRPFLTFFAGQMHGYVRPTLLKHWENRDPDMKIFGRMNKKDYLKHMKSSKYCICARGYEVNSPRVVEAISYECVPVIISDNFAPPFLEALNWESFSVFVLEKDIPNLKNILLSIPEKKYRKMQKRVKSVQRHFIWHPNPERYDIFHMILHSIWYARVFRMVQ